MNFEKWFRDAITMISLSNNNANLTEQISMGTLTTWAKTNAQQLRNWRLGKVGALKRLFGAERDSAEMNDPKLTHFIAEHAHPSLENACRDLEQTMSRLNIVISKLTSDQGKTIQNDFMSLSSICSVVENNLGMVAVISRATRSYSIGLRNADLEVASYRLPFLFFFH
ncbi:unnamed protein product [Anisakis simplex]|uniref:Acyl-CoA dehydrogenase family member 9, mitochondrial (inferred by orthology to a human protein) n=1 Tax=Anisakis simplex TaxID=6269 RepID=A0A0M3JCI9_ANISI|nr:unnamed protein product [Anisakis simplex]